MLYLAHQYLVESAKKSPKKVAVEIENDKISYKELDEYTNQLARLLKRFDLVKGDRVCFYLHKSINSIKSIFAILKADAVYVPLDVFSPLERIKKVIQDAKPTFLICDELTYKQSIHILESVKQNIKLVILSSNRNIKPRRKDNFFIEDVIKESTKELDYQNIDTNLAYIFYTSGSTGDPKGVMINHLNLINATEWSVEELNITNRDKLSCHPPLHFDLSTFDLYNAFKVGATLCLIPEKLSIFAGDLLSYIEKKKITIWNSVPSLLVYLAKSNVLKKNRITRVKKIFFNGEIFPTKYIIQWMKTYPQKEFVNMYGPTEATVQCTFYKIKKMPKNLKKLVPIGKACANSEVFAVKENNKLVNPGETGELYIKGSCLSPGYWNNSKRTKQSFIINPFNQNFKEIVYKTGDLVTLNKDFNYEYIGRVDHQIKYMGHRIELGEIESAFYSLHYINEAAVVAVNDEAVIIVAFIILNNKIDLKKIKIDLKKIIPLYMIPRDIRVVEKFPRTSTGKVNRIKFKKQYEEKK